VVLLFSRTEPTLFLEPETLGLFEIPPDPALLNSKTGTAQFSVQIPNRIDIGFDLTVFGVVRGSESLRAKVIKGFTLRWEWEKHQRNYGCDDQQSEHTLVLQQGRVLSNGYASQVYCYKLLK